MTIQEFENLQKKVSVLNALNAECKSIQSIITTRIKGFVQAHAKNPLDVSFVCLDQDLNEAISAIFEDYKKPYVEVLEKL